MKNFVRLLALVLACLFCVMTVVACDKKPTGGNTGGGNANIAGEVTVKEDGTRWLPDEWGFIRQYDHLPEDLNYDDEEVRILYWSDVEKPEFEQKEESDIARESAIFNRNLAIEQRLGVSLRFAATAGNAHNASSFVKAVTESNESGTQDYDIVGAYSRTAGSLMVQGLLVDVNAITNSYLDLDKPWWPSGLVDNFRVGNSLYFLSGDIAITAIDELHAIYFNKALIDEEFEEEASDYANEKGIEEGLNGTQYLYRLVRDGKWTVDKLIDMCAGYWQDGDSNAVVSANDQVGLVSASYAACTIYGGANLRMIDPDSEKTLVVSENYTSARTVRLVRNLNKLFGSNDYYDYNLNGDGGYLKPFTDGKALFCLQYLEMAENNLVGNEAVAHYGLVPLPKYDEQQKNYYTVIGNAFSIYCIPVTFQHNADNEQEKLSMLSAVLECWCSEAYRKTTPVVFELNMQLKYSETQDETDMCEYVRAGITFDLGRVIDSLLKFNGDQQVFTAAYNGESWVAAYSSHLDSMKIALEDFVAGLKTNVGTDK